MRSRPRALPSGRHALAAPIAAVVLLAAAACGSGDSAAGPAPASGTPTTASSTPTTKPTPSESETATALSAFEDEPTVKVLRKWAYLLGKAVPARDADLSSLRGVLAGQAMRDIRDGVADDLGNEWPGPQPFTPVRVNASGGTDTVDLCFLAQGWSLNPKTHVQISKKRVVMPAQFELTKRHARWVITGYYTSSISCSVIPVKGVAW